MSTSLGRRTHRVESDDFEYMTGFGNEFASESESYKGSLPKAQNSPQQCNYGLYAEQLSGTAFTAPRHSNQRSWLYRLKPSVVHEPYAPLEALDENWTCPLTFPNQLRWMPFEIEESKKFYNGIKTISAAGSPETRNGLSISVYTATLSMKDEAFSNSDGDFLIVPQQGIMKIKTEFGNIRLWPGEICVIQQGIRFAVVIEEGPIRGYILEIWGGHFVLPGLGPIGANGLAQPRDFLTPVASFEEIDNDFKIITKFQNKMFVSTQNHSCFDVVSWHGNYAPYKYDLGNFVPMNTVAIDHADPSIFTVLTYQSSKEGTAIADFVIFPPRWSVAEQTFRPPYYHRNCMSEFMGLIYGEYEAKVKDSKEAGFYPGGASLHSMMIPHGPDSRCFEMASKAELKPEIVAKNSLAFMFETCLSLKLSKWACADFLKGQTDGAKLDMTYNDCWKSIMSNFSKLDISK